MNSAFTEWVWEYGIHIRFGGTSGCRWCPIANLWRQLQLWKTLPDHGNKPLYLVCLPLDFLWRIILWAVVLQPQHRSSRGHSHSQGSPRCSGGWKLVDTCLSIPAFKKGTILKCVQDGSSGCPLLDWTPVSHSSNQLSNTSSLCQFRGVVNHGTEIWFGS